MTKLTDEFGARLSYWRQRRGLSQLQLATEAGLSGTRQINEYEHGKLGVSLRTVEKLLTALDVTIAEFYSETISEEI